MTTITNYTEALGLAGVALTKYAPASPAPMLASAASGLAPATAYSAVAIYTNGMKGAARKDLLDSYIRTGLPGEQALDDVLRSAVYGAADGALAALAARYPNNGFNTRQLIKLLGIDATFLLAASGCAPEVGLLILASHLVHGNWKDWIPNAVGSPWALAQEVAKAADRGAVSGFPTLESVARCDPGYVSVAQQLPPSSPATQPAQPATSTAATKEFSPMNTAAAASANVASIPAALNSIPPALRTAIEAMLHNSGAPGITLDELSRRAQYADEVPNIVASEVAAATKALQEKADEEIAALRAKARSAAAAGPVVLASSGAIPSGKMEMVQAETLFPEMKGVKLEVPRFVWDAPHPHVPAKIDGYIFRRSMLARVLRSLARAEPLWLQGHTGSGKTTFALQVAHTLGWPVMRIALDAGVDRSELVGRMQLKPDGKGGTASEWLPGVLERSIPHGYIVLLDEMDAGHPNSLYALQPVLEGNGLTLLEDGGRLVPFHPMTRLIATGNTAGSGDDSGLYPACRTLTAATLDRFQEFIEVPYLSTDEETALLRSNSGLKAAMAKRLAKFASEMRAAFINGELPVSFSPRRSVAFARAVEDYLSMLPAGNEDTAITLAITGKLMQATPREHLPRLTEVARASLGITLDNNIEAVFVACETKAWS